MYDFETAKTKMLENQLLASNLVSYEVAKEVASIAREVFLPETMKSKSYLDEEIFIDNDYFLISALSLARMMEAADINKNDTVLDLACGCGYTTAVLAKFAGMVIGVDNNKSDEEIATKNFANLCLDNAVLVLSEPEKGLKEQAPYDVIFIAGAIEEIPEFLLSELADGGRLITVCRHNNKKYAHDAFCYGEITKIIRKGRAFDKKIYSDIIIPKSPIKFKN